MLWWPISTAMTEDMGELWFCFWGHFWGRLWGQFCKSLVWLGMRWTCDRFIKALGDSAFENLLLMVCDLTWRGYRRPCQIDDGHFELMSIGSIIQILPLALVSPVFFTWNPRTLIKGQILRTSMKSIGPGSRSGLHPSARATRFTPERSKAWSCLQTVMISGLFLETVVALIRSSSCSSCATFHVSLTSTSARSRNDPPAINRLAWRCVLARSEVPSVRCCRASKLFWISLIKNNVDRMHY